MGFDQGPVTRKDPIPKVIYHPVRQQVRGRVIGGDPEVRKAADAFFDAHPTALRRYLSYVVGSDQPPFATGAKAKDLQELKGLEQLLAKAWTGWKLEELMGSVQADYRKIAQVVPRGHRLPHRPRPRAAQGARGDRGADRRSRPRRLAGVGSPCCSTWGASSRVAR